MSQIEHKIEFLRRLEKGWLNGIGDPISPQVLKSATALIAIMGKTFGFPDPLLSAFEDEEGTHLAITWHVNGKDIYTTVETDDSFTCDVFGPGPSQRVGKYFHTSIQNDNLNSITEHIISFK